MQTTTIHRQAIAMVLFLLLGGSAFAGHLSIEPTSFVATRNAQDSLPNEFAVQYDLSGLPGDVRIDLAELVVSADIGSDQPNALVDILVGPASTEWTGSVEVSTQPVPTTDSLTFIDVASVGQDSEININVTELVRQWLSERLDNNGLVIRLQQEGEVSSSLIVDTEGLLPAAKLSVYFSK